MNYVKGTLSVLFLTLAVVVLFFAYASVEHKANAQTGYLPELSEIDVNGVKVVPKNGVINIQSGDPTGVVVSGNTIVLKTYAPSVIKAAPMPTGH